MSIHASLSAIPFAPSVCAGSELDIQVVVSAREGAINAAQGVLRFDPAQLWVISVNTGHSVFRFWPTPPVVDQEQGTITFAGGLPTPGYNGEDGLLFTLRVVPNTSAENATLLSWDRSSVVLLNDGLGTPADLSLNGVRVNVYDPLPGLCEEVPTTVAPITDTVSPEPFDVVITKTDQGFQGEYFASYYAYDADSGVVRYEVRENGEPWHTEQSPYRLHIQKGEVVLEVKAVDAYGNERISSASANLQEREGMSFGPWWFWLILIIAVMATIWRIFRSSREAKGGTPEKESLQSAALKLHQNPDQSISNK